MEDTTTALLAAKPPPTHLQLYCNICINLHTLFVSVEQYALGFEDEDNVFWVGAVHDSGRLCAEELVGFVNFLKHVLKYKTSC